MSRLRVSPLLFRRIHKWVGLILGLQFVLWTISGAIMALLPSDAVGGHGGSDDHAAAIVWRDALISPASTLGSVPIVALSLRQVAGVPVYEVRSRDGIMLLDARSGRLVRIDEALARAVAAEASTAPVRSVARLPDSNLEAREHQGPMWRVNFADAANTSVYISADTGRLLVTRGDAWRAWDFVWMLHNMDYVGRTSFNHPLIIFVAFGALWLSVTGFYLLFKSFGRSDLRWISRRRAGSM
ncbi:PepSY domain-containing protein [Sphingomonas lenta]|uniref:BEACH domain-containing protein n=1 Tax=Sphingomonas lenta TaxID=1141887 RepID=A0A2A2SB53_9SPHN|nr:PepSY domain-containing protein [Sphingomonas lenta]PAX06478.1 hypothetical protein CKY28_17135 [Sphingomonas lenta]